jgi:hypothetical protein
VPVITEGPSVMPDPHGAGWLLLYDFCMGNDYGISRSPDLLAWSEESGVSFPPNARHGSLFPIDPQQLDRLQKAFPTS